MPQYWLEILAVVALGGALLCAAIILIDIVRGYRQMMGVMNWVWPITALYFGPVAVYAYWKLGRPMSAPLMQQMLERRQQHAAEAAEHAGHSETQDDSNEQQQQNPMKQLRQQMAQKRPFWQTVWIGVSHCGAGCTLGDLIGESAIFILGLRLAGQEYWPTIGLDFALAYILGIAFQYFSIAPMRGISGLKGIWAAVKADTLSLTAFEIGLFGWMAFFRFGMFPRLEVNNPAYWFLMQIGMCIGFATSYPMNWFLIKRRIKEPM